MDFDWAAWHKKFEDFGLSTTKSAVNGDAKFPGSFPEDDDIGVRDAEEVKNTRTGEASSYSNGTSEPLPAGNGKRQSGSAQGWKEEFDEDAADPVWKEHLDKLQATGKLKERDGQYSSTEPEQPTGAEREKEEETETLKFSFDELQVIGTPLSYKSLFLTAVSKFSRICSLKPKVCGKMETNCTNRGKNSITRQLWRHTSVH
jgi:hypothetical protein